MISKFERESIYHTVFEVLSAYPMREAPTPLAKICALLGIELVPLTKNIMQGFTQSFIFGFWGNRDGALQVVMKNGRVYARIGYNDFIRPQRVRFTIAEEISHFILGHYTDRRCDKDCAGFDEDFYRSCEQQARFSAGLLLCPPHTFYGNPPASLQEMSLRYAVSHDCAAACRTLMMQYKDEILCNRDYQELLVEKFSGFDKTCCYSSKDISMNG